MMNMVRRTALAASAVAMLLTVSTTSLLLPQTAMAASVEEGKAAAVDRKKGNCLACHAMAEGDLPGNIGPPLVNMKDRFPDKKKLHDQIWDAQKNNPNTIMPPFGKHQILTDSEVDSVVEYVYSL